MVYIYNPELFDLEVNEKDTTNGTVYFEDVYCKESKKKLQENAEKGYRRIPLVTAKFFDNKVDLDNFDKVPAYVSSYKKTNKNGKLNITAKISQCQDEAKSDIGFIAAVPIKGYINGFGFDEGIEPLKAVLKYVDKFSFNDENYTQIVYIVGRASKKITNLLGSIHIDAKVIAKGDVVNTTVTEVIFQNEEIRQETRVTNTTEGADAVNNAKEAGKDFSSFANDITEPFAREFKPNNTKREGNNNNRGGGDRKPRNNNNNRRNDSFRLEIPEYQGRDRDRSRNKKKRRR
jgi:hypothetical protein